MGGAACQDGRTASTQGNPPWRMAVVIEFDTYDGDVFDGIKRSYDYLAGLGLG